MQFKMSGVPYLVKANYAEIKYTIDFSSSLPLSLSFWKVWTSKEMNGIVWNLNLGHSSVNWPKAGLDV